MGRVGWKKREMGKVAFEADEVYGDPGHEAFKAKKIRVTREMLDFAQTMVSSPGRQNMAPEWVSGAELGRKDGEIAS